MPSMLLSFGSWGTPAATFAAHEGSRSIVTDLSLT